jgi:hypothetical protein
VEAVTAGSNAVVTVAGAAAGLNAVLRRRLGELAWFAFASVLYGGRWNKDDFVRRYSLWSVIVSVPIVVGAIIAIATQ